MVTVFVSPKVVLGHTWDFRDPGDFLCVCVCGYVMDSELSKGYIPFEFCTARNIIPLYKRVFASDERSTVECL